jgi:hypothetical protein
MLRCLLALGANALSHGSHHSPLERIMARSFIGLLSHSSKMLLFTIALTIGVAMNSGRLAAENFRIETQVFEGDAEEPSSRATTLFCDGVVYDFLVESEQTAVFSRPSGKNPGYFILLDDEREIRTKISTDRVKSAMDNLRAAAEKQSDRYLKFAANPEFEESFEPGNGQLVLASHLESYTVHTTPAKHPKAAAEYREFLDWYAQLNTLLSGVPIPPQPRLELNEALSRHKAIPSVVERRREGEDGPIRAEHEFLWLLSQDDMTRIEKVRGAQVSYREVSNEEYRNQSNAAEAE